MDSGYFSESAIHALSEMRFGVMCSDTVSLVDDMIVVHADTLADRENHYIADEDRMPVPDTKLCGGSYDAYIFYDEIRAAQEKECIHKKVDLLAKEAKKRKRYSKNINSSHEPFLRITRTEKQPLIGKAGYFVIVSNAGYDARTMLEIDRERDFDRKEFVRFRTHFGFDSPCTLCMETRLCDDRRTEGNTWKLGFDI
jgi:hypothetical protein